MAALGWQVNWVAESKMASLTQTPGLGFGTGCQLGYASLVENLGFFP